MLEYHGGYPLYVFRHKISIMLRLAHLRRRLNRTSRYIHAIIMLNQQVSLTYKIEEVPTALCIRKPIIGREELELMD